jgi:hypothetical protein
MKGNIRKILSETLNGRIASQKLNCKRSFSQKKKCAYFPFLISIEAHYVLQLTQHSLQYTHCLRMYKNVTTATFLTTNQKQI